MLKTKNASLYRFRILYLICRQYLFMKILPD